MEYTYHTMEIGDYDEIYALWSSDPGIGLSEADNRDNIAAYLLRNPDQSFVCKANSKIIGTILCGNDGRRAYIHHTAVATEYRRQGIATQLTDMALEEQKKYGMTKCHLFIISDNEPGKAFWLKSGFFERYDIGIMSKEF